MFNFRLNFRILKVGTPPLPLSRWLRRDFKVRDRTSRQVRDRPPLALGSCRHHQVLEPGLGQVREPRGTEPNEPFRSEFGQNSWNPKKTTKSHSIEVAFDPLNKILSQNRGDFARIHQKSKKFRNHVQHFTRNIFYKYLAKF